MRRKKEFAAASAPKPTYFQVGLNGTAEEFRAVNKEAFGYMDYDGEHFGTKGQLALQKGAIQAFLEGRPENVQTILANPSEFTVGVRYSTEKVDCKKILFDLTEGSDRSAAIIALALANIPEQEKKQAVLNEALYEAINCTTPYPGEEAFIAALLEAGADANAEFVGSPGRILAMAATNAHPPSVIKMLYDGGANFDDALFRIRTRGYWDDKRELCIEKLKAYREVITGEPATIEVKPEILLQMQQAIADLTTKVERLEASANTKPAQARKKITPPAL